jgi:hypothetical protein
MTSEIQETISKYFEGKAEGGQNIQAFEVSGGAVNEIKIEKKKEPFINHIEELNECMETLKTVDYRYTKQFISMWCEEDKHVIADLFREEFKNVPKKNKLRIDTLHFLGQLGIIVYDTQ